MSEQDWKEQAFRLMALLDAEKRKTATLLAMPSTELAAVEALKLHSEYEDTARSEDTERTVAWERFVKAKRHALRLYEQRRPSSGYHPATDGEARHGLNDVWPGDPYPNRAN